MHNYSISLHPGTLQLFAYVEIESEEKWGAIASTDVCRRWWVAMAPLMETDSEGKSLSPLDGDVAHLAAQATPTIFVFRAPQVYCNRRGFLSAVNLTAGDVHVAPTITLTGHARSRNAIGELWLHGVLEVPSTPKLKPRWLRGVLVVPACQ